MHLSLRAVLWWIGERLLASGLVIAPTLGACGSPTSPNSKGDLVITLQGESGKVIVVETASREVSARFDLGFEKPVAHLGGTYSPSRGTLAVITHDQMSGLSDLIMADAETGRVRWSRPLSSASRVVPMGSVEVWGSGAIQTTADGAFLIAAPAFSGGHEQQGLAIIDAQSGDLTGFVGGVTVPPWDHAIASVGQTQGLPVGTLAVLSMDRGAQEGATSFVVIDPSTRTLARRIPIDPGDLYPGDRIQAASVSPARATAFLSGLIGIYAFDFASQRVVARNLLPSQGSIFVDPSGSRVLVTDRGDWPDSPGSGKVFVFSESLEPVASISLGPDPRTGQNTVSNSITWSADGTTAFVMTGTASLGVLYAPQESRVLILDLLQQSVKGSIALGDYNAQQMFLLR